MALGAVVFLTGFDSGGIENAKTTGGTFSVQSTIAKHPSSTNIAYALRCNPTTTATGFAAFGTVAATTGLPAFFPAQTQNLRFYFYITTAPATLSEQILGCRTTAAAQNWAVRLDSNRNLSLYNNANALITTGATVLALNTWYRIEVQSDNNGATGTHIILINGTQEWNTTCAQGTVPGEYAFGKSINRNGQTIDVYYDDILVTSSGNLPGDGIVACLLPAAKSGTFDFNSGTNSSDNLEVDEAPLDATTYVMCAASATHDGTFIPQSTKQNNVGGNIWGVLMTAAGIREDTSGTSAITAQIKSSSSTATNSTALNATTTPSNIAVLTKDNPNGTVTWTRAAIEASTFGITVGGTNAIAVRLSAVYIEVAGDYAAFADAKTITLSGPTASATGGAVATADAATIALSGPTASATGAGNASASAATIILSGPTASATGDGNASASSTTVTLSGPTASASGTSGAVTAPVVDRPVGGAIRRRRRRLVQRASVQANQIARATAEAVHRHTKARQETATAADSAQHAALIEALSRDIDRASAVARDAAAAAIMAADDFARMREKLRMDARLARLVRDAEARAAEEAKRIAAAAAHAAAVQADDAMAMMAVAIIDLIECEEALS